MSRNFLSRNGTRDFHAPGGHRFVGAGAVKHMQRLQHVPPLRAVLWRSAPYGSGRGSRRTLRPSLRRKHHFDAHGFNFPRHQVHRRRSANSGHIVGFDVIDNVADRIQPFLDGKVNFMVHGAEG